MSTATLSYRPVSLADGAAIWRLVQASEALELNTCYAYLLMCRDFADTCLVAEEDGAVLGFVVAYRPPARRETVFVWQIGVAIEARGRGVARGLLMQLIASEGCRGVRFLESTVTPSNIPSQKLFRSVARAWGVPCEVGPGLAARWFQDPSHEPEDRFRIGPLGDTP